jgi:plastocyanin
MRILLCTAFLFAHLAAQNPQAVRANSGTASVEIIVSWKGKHPKPRPFEIPAGYRQTFRTDGAFCHGCIKKGLLKDETLLIDDRSGIRNVAVSFPRLKASKPGLRDATLDNVSCRFSPHVQFVPVGRPITITNSDPLTHNARIGRADRKALANRLIPPKSRSSTPPVPRPGIYLATCDVHPWMKAYLIAVRNPWCALTAAGGVARIAAVPAGKDLDLVVWHESLGQVERKVTLEPGKKLRIALTQKDFKSRRRAARR